MKNNVLLAYERIKPYIRETILDYSMPLSQRLGNRIFLKCENLQYTGSFKARGALNKLLSLTALERTKGVVAASTGNHGTAIAFGTKTLNIPGRVFVPNNASKAKIENIKRYEIPIHYSGNDCMIAEISARQYAAEHHLTYVSPYNDKEVVCGQGSIGVELQNQLENIDAVFVPVGGGGLIAGIASYLKELAPNIKIIGCLPENSPIMVESIQTGKITHRETEPTLSDATAGGIEPGAITFPLCQKYVDDWVLVSEEEIQYGIIEVLKSQRQLIEGAAAVAVAALMKTQFRFKNKNIVIILSGGNISIDNLKGILADDQNN